ADDRDATASADHVRQRREERLELLELAVHRDAQRLERARGRVDAADPHRADGADDRASEIERGRELTLGERALHAPRDAPRALLVAVVEDDVGQLLVREPLDELERGLAGRAIHAHVDRTLAAEAHPARGVVDLRRADAE